MLYTILEYSRVTHAILWSYQVINSLGALAVALPPQFLPTPELLLLLPPLLALEAAV